jgi:hypothetical protein
MWSKHVSRTGLPLRLLSLPVVAFCWARKALTRSAAFFFAARNQSVTFRTAASIPTAHVPAVRMRIESAVGPGSSPGRVVDEYGVRAPVESREAPTPGTKCHAQANAETEAVNRTSIPPC